MYTPSSGASQQPIDLGTQALTDQDLNYWVQSTYDQLQNKSIWSSLNPIDEATFDVGGINGDQYWTGSQYEKHWLYNGTNTDCPKVNRGNEVNYFGIGMYEAWAGDPLWVAEGLTFSWKAVAHQTTPNANEMFWLGYGYNAYFNIHNGSK
jgi:hypothetical protein